MSVTKVSKVLSLLFVFLLLSINVNFTKIKKTNLKLNLKLNLSLNLAKVTNTKKSSNFAGILVTPLTNPSASDIFQKNQQDQSVGKEMQDQE